MSALYIIATPIGNLKDITYRAVETIFSVDVLLCEDTRNTQRLLEHYKQPDQSQPKLIAFHEHNEDQKITDVIKMLQQGQNIGLVSDAGTPLISDPGYQLVRLCRKKGYDVISIPGPSAVISALSVSGLPTDKFTFLSFLPRKHSKQVSIFKTLKQTELKQTIAFYESPQRVHKTLESIEEVFGDIEVTLVRELTKVYEEVITQTISQLKQQTDFKGEFVILFTTG